LPWDNDEKHKLATQFSSGESIDEIAEHHGRTKGAITSELKHQGLIDE